MYGGDECTVRLARIVYFLIILFSIAITPYVAEYATNIRGYKAYGGEYLIPLLGWIIATVYYEICKEINHRQKLKSRRKNNE